MLAFLLLYVFWKTFAKVSVLRSKLPVYLKWFQIKGLKGISLSVQSLFAASKIFLATQL